MEYSSVKYVDVRDDGVYYCFGIARLFVSLRSSSENKRMDNGLHFDGKCGGKKKPPKTNIQKAKDHCYRYDGKPRFLRFLKTFCHKCFLP
jgi:hypothetical protein